MIYRYPGGFGEGDWGGIILFVTAMSFLIALSVLLFIINFFWSRKHGEIAGGDPWLANSLEWATTSPPPPYNFERIPEVRSFMPMRDIRGGVLAREAAPAGAGS